MGIKNADIHADFFSAGKVAKNIMRKKLSTKKGPKNLVFYFYYWLQKFLGWIFYIVYNGFELGFEICV